MLFPICVYLELEQHTIYPWSNILIKKSSDEGHGGHFASSLDWSKSLHSFALTISDESV